MHLFFHHDGSTEIRRTVTELGWMRRVMVNEERASRYGDSAVHGQVADGLRVILEEYERTHPPKAKVD